MEFSELVDEITHIPDHKVSELDQKKLKVLAGWVNRNTKNGRHDECRKIIGEAQSEIDGLKAKKKVKA